MTPLLVFLTMVCAALISFVIFDRRSAPITDKSIKKILKSLGYTLMNDTEGFIGFWSACATFAFVSPEKDGMTAISSFYRLTGKEDIERIKRIAERQNALSPNYAVYVVDDKYIEFKAVISGCDNACFKRNISTYIETILYGARLFFKECNREDDIMEALKESRRTIRKRSGR